MMKRILITILLYCCCTTLWAQGWERLYQFDTCSAISFDKTLDHGFIIAYREHQNNANYYKLMRTDSTGNPLWVKTYNIWGLQEVRATNDGGFVLLELPQMDTFANEYVTGILKTDANGDSLWQKYHYAWGGSIEQTADSGYVLLGSRRNATIFENRTYMLKLNASGDSLWSNLMEAGVTGPSVKSAGSDVCELSTGGYLMTGNIRVSDNFSYEHNYLTVHRMDVNGDTLWERSFMANNMVYGGISIQETSHGEVIVLGKKAAGLVVLKLDLNGNLLWERNYSGSSVGDNLGYAIEEADDGTYMVFGTWGYAAMPIGSGASGQGDMYLMKLDTSGYMLWDKRFILNPNHEELLTGGLITYDEHYALLGYTRFEGDMYLLKVDSLGNTYSQFIVGNVHEDLNNNCLLDTGEQALKNVLLVAQGSTQQRYAVSDSLGNYTISVDTGTYTVSAVLSPYWQPCATPSNLAIVNTNGTDTIDWAMEPLVQCPLLQVDLSAPFLRRTGGGSTYTVNYCNVGTVDEPNAVVDLTLDPNLIVLNTSIPIANQVANVYTFNIGQVNQGACGSFQVQVVVDSIAIVGQTHCSEAHIYPDSNCLSTWNGARLTVGAQCDNDSVSFQIENIGTAMMQAETYYVYEDNVMFHTGTTNILGPGGTQVIKHAATPGKTYRLTVNQANGFPPILGDSVATIAIEGCFPFINGSFNTGFVTQFSNGNSSPFIAVDCQASIAAYDPNDKSAQPAGYDSLHYIYQHTALDYKIRFQNTGNDTAFLVVIRDTLSAHLDPATLIMGASSHPYIWSISGQGILEVRFENIMLPDSNVNEMASHGFFRFRIKQKANNPIGTTINNQAAIYFDYNPPIITNTTFHTVGENFEQISVAVDKVENPKLSVQVYPNPFYDFTTIKVLGEEYTELSIKIIDVSGRLIKQDVFKNNEYILTREQLSPGIYFYQLEGDNQLINTGKIIVQ